MISDVLFEALEEIERYQRDCPEAYSDPELKKEIESVKSAMRGLQRWLDTPPSLGEEGLSSFNFEREEEQIMSKTKQRKFKFQQEYPFEWHFRPTENPCA